MPKPLRCRLPLVQASLSAALALLAAPAFAQSLSLHDAGVMEGSNGTSMLLFEARLSAPASSPVTFDFATGDGSAVAGSDYTAISLVGLSSIPAGQTSLMVAVPVTGDSAIETNEYINAALSNVAGATVADGAAKGLIVNDDHLTLQSAPADAGAQAGSIGLASGTPALSRDGRFVAFTSTARDLVPGRPANVVQNVYVRDNRTGVTTLASVAANGGDTNGDCNNPALSADGRYVVFQCYANNLVAGDTNTLLDVYRRDLRTGTTSLVSVNRTGSGAAGGFSSGPEISADGRYIAFQSTASDLVAFDTNGLPDAFFRDMQTGTTTLVSVGPDGIDSAAEGAWSPALSADGRFVVFDKDGSDVWRRDMQSGELTHVSVGSSGENANSSSYNGGVSADGRFVVFSSWATNLGGPGVLWTPQIYVRDAVAGTTEMVSVSPAGTTSLGNSANSPSISDEGRYVAFQSYAKATADDSDGHADVFVRDLQANTTVRVSKPWTGTSSVGESTTLPKISGDGRFVAFLSPSPQLLPGDGNGQDDVFRVEVPQDPSLPTLRLYDYWVGEGDAGARLLHFDVGLSAPATAAVSFDFVTADGTAVAGLDYGGYNVVGQTIAVGQQQVTFAIEIAGDAVPEADEAFNIYLGNVSGARLLDGHAIVIIGNDDVAPQASLSIGEVTVTEGNSGTQVASFTLTLSQATTTPVRFDIATADGTAVAGSDYLASRWHGLTIPAGSISQVFNVGITGDGLVEADETFQVELTNVTGATVLDGQATGTIANDDVYPVMWIGDVALSEGNSGSQLATFTLNLSAAAASPVTYDIATSDGTAVAGSDFVASSLTGQSIPAGASSATFTVAINGDNLVEADESFQVSLANVAGAIVSDGQAIGTIHNDDVLPSLSMADVSIAEGDSGTRLATFTVQLSAPASEPVGFTIETANGTAVAPGDYTANSQSSSLWIAPGASSAAFTVSIIGDTAIEPSETFQVNISNVTGANVADGTAVGTISNDDVLPSLSIADVSTSEGQNSSKLATFTVTLSKVATSPVSFTIATANGTAVAPGDYTARTATGQLIAAGTVSKTFTVSIRGDKQVEPSETYFVNLSNVSSNATIADGQAVGSIVNDDGATLSLSRVTTGGLYDDVDDRRGDPVLSPKEYALLLLDTAQQVCARADGASVVGVDGVESVAVLADLADTANNMCARRPTYSAVMKAGELGFLVDGAAGKARPHGTQVLALAAQGAKLRSSSLTVLADGHERPLIVLLAATPSAVASERAAQTVELNRLVRSRLSADPQARLVVLGAAGHDSLVDLTARSLPAGTVAVERVWVSAAVLTEFDGVRLEIPAAPQPKPAHQVLQLQP